jgi:hypothetical protein
MEGGNFNASTGGGFQIVHHLPAHKVLKSGGTGRKIQADDSYH